MRGYFIISSDLPSRPVRLTISLAVNSIQPRSLVTRSTKSHLLLLQDDIDLTFTRSLQFYLA